MRCLKTTRTQTLCSASLKITQLQSNGQVYTYIHVYHQAQADGQGVQFFRHSQRGERVLVSFLLSIRSFSTKNDFSGNIVCV